MRIVNFRIHHFYRLTALATAFYFLIILGLPGCNRGLSEKNKNYYIDNETGNDHNQGMSPMKPWKSLKRLNKIQLNPGSVIHLKNNQHFEGYMRIKGIVSTDKSPLIICSYGNGRATIDAGDSTGILIENCNHVLIRNLNITGNGRNNGNLGNGIELRYAKYAEIDSVNASGFMWSGIRITGGGNIRVHHIYAHNNGFAGIDAESGEEYVYNNGSGFKTLHDLYIGYCVAENNPGCPLVRDNHSGNGILIGGVTRGIVEYCEAMNNGWDMPRDGNGPVGIWAYMCDSITIQYCYSHHNKTSVKGKDGGGFDLDGGVTHSIMQYNHSAYNEGGGYGLFQYRGAAEWNDNIIRFNTSLNDGSKNSHAGIHIWCDPSAIPMTNCKIFDNIVISDQGHDVYFEPGTYKGFSFENNIFTMTARGDQFIGGNFKSAVFDNNQYWSFYRSTRNLPQPEVTYDHDPIFSEPSLDTPMMIR